MALPADNPICYGQPEKCGCLPECATCQYAESCRWYIDNPAPFDKHGKSTRGHWVSYERYSYSAETAKDCDPPDDSEVEAVPQSEQMVPNDDDDYNKPVYSQADLHALLVFLLREVDDYTLAIVECVLREDHTMASTVAKAFGVSREAMHRKLMDSCRRYPELAAMLKSVMYRCKSLACVDRRGSIIGRKNVKRPDNGRQMEFSFTDG